MGISVTLSGAFADNGVKGQAKRLETDFVEELGRLVRRYGGHISSGTITGDNITASVDGQGKLSVSVRK